MRVLPWVVACLAIAGCAVPASMPPTSSAPSGSPTSSPSSSPLAPSDGSGAWTGWDGRYAALAYGYGFIGPDASGYGPALPVTAVDDAGHVLWMKVAQRIRDDAPRGLQMDAGLEPWRPVVAPVLADGNLSQPDVKVVALRTGTLPPANWTAVHEAIEAGLASARDPKPNGGAYVADRGSTLVVAAGLHVTLDGNHDHGGGWQQVLDQMDALRAWIEPKE